jgi:hypothetical protein
MADAEHFGQRSVDRHVCLRDLRLSLAPEIVHEK